MLSRDEIRMVIEEAERRDVGAENNYDQCYTIVRAMGEDLLDCMDLLEQFVTAPLRYSDKCALVAEVRYRLEGWKDVEGCPVRSKTAIR